MHDMSSHRNGLFVMRRLLSTTNLYLSPLKQDWSHSVPTFIVQVSTHPGRAKQHPGPRLGPLGARLEEDRVTTRHNNQTVSRHDTRQDNTAPTCSLSLSCLADHTVSLSPRSTRRRSSTLRLSSSSRRIRCRISTLAKIFSH